MQESEFLTSTHSDGLKLFLRDAVSSLRQGVGLSHNKTRRQVRASKVALIPREVNAQRLSQIAKAAPLSDLVIEGFVREAKNHEVDLRRDQELWNARKAAMMSERDCTTLYALVRSLKPRSIVETGGASGASTSYILTACERNGHGDVRSIDRRSSHENEYGQLIPDYLLDRWELLIQHDTPLLPVLLNELGTIDFFLHDSNHSFQHMAWEFELAWEHLSPGGCLASHDVLATSAFDDFQRIHSIQIKFRSVVGNLGFMLKSGGSSQ